MTEPMFEITKEEGKDNYAKFVISPLEQGYGQTLGNSLRRVLLTSLPGAAITKVKISGAKHQFSTVKGMKEDVVEFILNLKKVRITSGEDKPVRLTLSVKSAGEVKAGDIKTPANVKIANPDLILANLVKGAKLECEMEAECGVGYSSAEERSVESIGEIPVDASFSPVVRVNFKVDETRVGRLTNYDKLILDVWTDGAITPQEAITEASRILVSYFSQVAAPKKVKKESEEKPSSPTVGAVGNLSVEEVGLPTRIANALYKAGYETVSDLVKAKREDLVKVRNLGEKSLKIISAALAEKGVTLGE